MCTTSSRVLTTHEITFMKSHGYGAPDPLESPSQVFMCDVSKKRKLRKNNMRAATVNSVDYPLWLSLPLLFFSRTQCHCWGRSCRLDWSSYPSPELMNSALHGRNGPVLLDQRKGQKFGLVILGRRPPWRWRSTEALVTPGALPCQGLEDVGGRVRVHQAFRLPVSLLVLAQGDAVLDRDMGTGPICGCISLRLRMLCSHRGILEGLVQPLLHALVSDHLVQLCIPAALHVVVGIFNGLACQQCTAKDA